jgi:hypothetical protein
VISASNLFEESQMSEELPVHPSAIEVAENGVGVPAALEAEAAYHIVTTPTDCALYRGELLMGAFPTLAEAEAAKKIAEAH